MADLRHRERRMAQLRRRHRRHQVLAARPDRRRQLQRPGDRLGVDVDRQLRQPEHARRRRVVGAARRHRRLAGRGDPEPLPQQPAAEPLAPPGDPADDRRRAVLQHAAVAGSRGGRDDRRDALDLQPEGLRGRDPVDERALDAARGRLLDRRRRGRADLLGHRQRLRGLRQGEDRAALPRLRPQRQRHGRRDGRHPARGARGARLPQRAAVFHQLAAHRRARQGDPRLADRRPAHHPGSAPGVGAGLGRPHRRARLGLPHRAEQRRRVRRGHLAERFVALLGQRQRLVDARRRQRAGLRLPADGHHHERLLRRRPAGRQPLLGDDHRRRRRDRPADVALPGCPPRTLGLRLPHPPEPGRRGGRRPPDPRRWCR